MHKSITWQYLQVFTLGSSNKMPGVRKWFLSLYCDYGGVKEEICYFVLQSLISLCNQGMLGNHLQDESAIPSYCTSVLMPESLRFICKSVLKISWADVDLYLEHGNVAQINKMVKGEQIIPHILDFFHIRALTSVAIGRTARARLHMTTWQSKWRN